MSSISTWPASVALFAMITPLPIWQSCATWVLIMNRLSSPTRVTPPPPAVPGFIVTCSRMRLRAPMTSSTGSPRYFRSCGRWPSEAKGKISVASPIAVRAGDDDVAVQHDARPERHLRADHAVGADPAARRRSSAPSAITAVGWISARRIDRHRLSPSRRLVRGQDHRRELRLGAERVADPRLAAELPDLAAAAHDVDVQLERVARAITRLRNFALSMLMK